MTLLVLNMILALTVELQAVLHTHLGAASKMEQDMKSSLKHLQQAYQLHKQSNRHPEQAIRCSCELAEALCDSQSPDRAEEVAKCAKDLLVSNPNLRRKYGVRVELACGHHSDMSAQCYVTMMVC